MKNFKALSGLLPFAFVAALVSGCGMNGSSSYQQSALLNGSGSNGSSGSSNDYTVTPNASPGTGSAITTLSLTSGLQSVAPGGTAQFTASGGTSPYYYSMASGDGTVSDSGFYIAPSTNGSAVIKVTDSTGATATASISIAAASTGGTLTLAPSSGVMARNTAVDLTAAGGQPPYVFSVVAGGGTINSSNGHYVSPNQDGYVQLQVRDSAGTAVQVTFTVYSGPTCNEIDGGKLSVRSNDSNYLIVSCPAGQYFNGSERYTGTTALSCQWQNGYNAAMLTCRNSHDSTKDANHVYITCCTP